MVKPSNRTGQRRRAISLRTIRGRLGAIRVVSTASAATPAVAARRINCRLVVEGKGNQFWVLCRGMARLQVTTSSITRINAFVIWQCATVSSSETESGLQFDFAISSRARRERTTQLKRIGFVKQTGSHNPVRIRQVVIVESVPSNHAEGEVVTPVGIGRHHRWTHAEYRAAVSSATTGST